ncbi:MAG: sigma-70 family RNA polymerase sigma factor [Alphaproteobacteria bacterium]|nr:sigma-70 family RNA polymerase sigma factor [Alphaproteobacteria bacterium]
MTNPRQQLVFSLAKEMHADLVRFLRGRLRDRDEAEEVAQATYVRLLESEAGEGDLIANGRAYMFRTAANIAHDRWRRRALGNAVLVQIRDVPGIHRDGESTPEDLFVARSRLDDLVRALDELPENCRKALLLGRLNGLSHKEIAARLGVSVSMVKKYQRRALSHCHRRLYETGQEAR